jgi:hypothetical protein
MDGPLTRPQKVVRFRIALSQAQDAAARASAIAELASFVNVHDAVVLSAVNGKIVWQTWRDRAPGFSVPRELGREGPIEILKQLAPIKQVELAPEILVAPVELPRWYRRRPIQLGIAASVAAALVGSYLWVRTAGPSSIRWNPDITGPETGGGR